MTTPDLGRLTRVDIRTIWKHEAAELAKRGIGEA
jgi:hypothetical protein